MQDLEIEQRLRRYQVPGPPAALRARVLSVVAVTPAAWPWALAASALLALAITLYVATSRVDRFIAAADARASVRETVVRDIAEMLGSGTGARAEAERIVSIQELESAAAASTLAMRER